MPTSGPVTRTIKTGGKGAWGMPMSTGGSTTTTRTMGGGTIGTGGRTIKTGGGMTKTVTSGGGRGGQIGFGGATGTKTITTGGSTTTTVKNEIVTDPAEAMKGKNGSGYRGK